jgi:cyclopropane-fatty-acyl-phospholipid synthase
LNATTDSLRGDPGPAAPRARPRPARLLFSVLAALDAGRLVVVTPTGQRHTFEGSRPGPDARLEIRDWEAIGAMVKRAEIGLFEGWRDGTIATPDMTALLTLLALNRPALEGVYFGHPVARWLLRAAHALRANTRAGSARNIHAHYDLGNDFYRLWLDPGMTYSSALFTRPGLGLAEAQDAKVDRILDRLGIEAGHRVLEVGCGWGGFAERAAATRGCRVDGVTISRAQLAYARDRIERAGLADRVDLRLRDYRDLEGEYDRLVSVEMVEAVGERYWPRYFRMVRERLKPGGRAAIQSIVIEDAAFDDYRRTSDFIREYIFPGGMLPSPRRLREEAAKAGLVVDGMFGFGRDYAETLRRWRAAFDAAEARVRALGFDDAFLAAWRFYLHYCEAGFDTGRVDVVQLELSRPA